MNPFKKTCTPLALTISSVVSAATAYADPAARDGTTTLEEVVITAPRIREALQAERALTPGGVTVVDTEQLYERSVAETPSAPTAPEDAGKDAGGAGSTDGTGTGTGTDGGTEKQGG